MPVNPLPPDIQLRFEERPGYLFVDVSGPRDSFEISLAYWREIVAQVERRGTTRLMVVERLGQYEGVQDIPRIVEALIAMGLDKIKVAFVVERIEMLSQLEHGEILALERGANGRVFTNPALAERWLRHGGG